MCICMVNKICTFLAARAERDPERGLRQGPVDGGSVAPAATERRARPRCRLALRSRLFPG